MKNIKCPSCDSVDTNLIGAVPAAKTFNGKKSISAEKIISNLYRCLECDLVFKSPKIKNVDAYELYNNSNVQQYTIPRRCDHPGILQVISKLQPKSVLDFGCYTGDLLFKIEDNISKYGVEINAAAAKLAAQKSRAAICKDLKNINTKVDCIVLCDVIEHLDDPAVALMNLSDHLNNKGFMIITTGNSNHWYSKIIGSRWYYSLNAEHISFINPNWLNWFCKKKDNLSLQQLKFFRYEKKSLKRMAYIMAQSLAYLVFPKIYKKIQKIKGRDYGTPGLSAWQDHMLIVLRKK